MRVLLTGAAGFIGSHVVEHFLKETDWHVIGVDSLAHKGKIERIEEWLHHDRFSFLKLDLAKESLWPLLKEVDVIINMASESHVDRSIADPVPFIRNNVDLTVNMLEYARKVVPKLFVQISTDEVYGASHDYPHTEDAPKDPGNPYSASKSAQEELCLSYENTYGLPLVIVNPVNNIGEKQDPEKFLPMLIQKIARGETVNIHTVEGEIGSRHYIHARNTADALKFIIENPRHRRYHIKGQAQLSNLALAQLVSTLIGKPLKYELIAGRLGQDLHYDLSGTNLEYQGWTPPMEFIASLEKTVKWELEHEKISAV